jgi:hypothetical protein
LFGFDEEAGAIGDPWVRCFHWCQPVLDQFSVLSFFGF